MKRKIYFIISSIIQIIGALYIIINANAIVQLQLDTISETYSMFPIEFQQDLAKQLENGGVEMLVITSIFQMILNVVVVNTARKNKLSENKGKLIAISLLCLFTAESTIIMLSSIINFIVALTIKRNKTKEKVVIPEVEYQKSTRKELIFGMILVLAYFSPYLLSNLIPEDVSINVLRFIDISYNVVLLILSILCFKDRLKRDIKLLKDNAKTYIKYILPKLGIMYIIFFITNIICIMITGQADSVNQSTLESMPLWYTIPLAVFWAPIVEEAVFRGVLRRFIKNNKLFIVTSAIIFGVLHTMSEVTLLNVIIMAIPYMILGGFFAYIYAKTENISCNILAHCFQNTIASLIMAITACIIM